MTFIRIAGSNSQEIGKNFENAIKEYLKKIGYRSTGEPSYTKEGYQLDYQGTLEDTPVIVECKAHEDKIDMNSIAAFFGKYMIDRNKPHEKGIFYSLSPLTDNAKRFYKFVKEKEQNEPNLNIRFEIITVDKLIKNLIDLQEPLLEADFTKAERKFDKLVKDYNIILNYDIFIEDKENHIFLQYLNSSYYWICIVSTIIKGNYFLILDKTAEIPKDHKALADQLISESLLRSKSPLKDVKYLLSEKAEINPDRLLEAIVYCDGNNEWKRVFKKTIELLSKSGNLDILSELLKNPAIRDTVSENDVISKIEDISENLLDGIENWKEEFCDTAQHCSQFINFTFEHYIKINNKDAAVENLKKQIEIQSQILVLDKSRRAECVEKISQYIDTIVKINGETSSNYYISAYDSSNKALKRLNNELETQEVDKDKYIRTFAESDYSAPYIFIELYEYQKKLLEKARDEENASWADKEISELISKINELHAQIARAEIEEPDQE